MARANHRRRIVLAEDNPADVGLVRHALKEHHLECDLQVLADGEAVVSLIDRLDRNAELPRPDLLLLDLYLPGRSGREILRHLSASDRCAGTPVVVLTGSDAPFDQELANNNNSIAHYFRKPSSLTEFLKLGGIIRTVINGPTVD